MESGGEFQPAAWACLTTMPWFVSPHLHYSRMQTWSHDGREDKMTAYSTLFYFKTGLANQSMEQDNAVASETSGFFWMNALWLSLRSKADLARRTVDLGRPTVVLDLVSHLVRKPFKLRRAGFESNFIRVSLQSGILVLWWICCVYVLVPNEHHTWDLWKDLLSCAPQEKIDSHSERWKQAQMQGTNRCQVSPSSIDWLNPRSCMALYGGMQLLWWLIFNLKLRSLAC